MPERAREAIIPIESAAIHHMSYARTDEQIRRKITTFSHAHQVVPGWFENVWKRWDDNPALEKEFFPDIIDRVVTVKMTRPKMKMLNAVRILALSG